VRSRGSRFARPRFRRFARPRFRRSIDLSPPSLLDLSSGRRSGGDACPGFSYFYSTWFGRGPVSTRVPAFAVVRSGSLSCLRTHSCEVRNCNVFRNLPKGGAIRLTSLAFRSSKVRNCHVFPDPCFGRPVCDSLDLVPDPCSVTDRSRTGCRTS
jgi:hypothetical protein